MSFKQEIDKLIKSNLKTYQDNSDRFIADYNRELELTKEYNGRQLLELLQNADDADSKEVLIIWNKDHSKLVISNKGEPFEAGGIKSLMLANLSTKTKISYIGNKGLGFRSILNWAEKINIRSNGCIISFSELIAKDVFDNQLNLSEEDRRQLRIDRDLSAQTVPFPILAMPIIADENTQSNWSTSIEIIYKKEFEVDIQIQLAEIKEEILLFLNNIQKITIQSDLETIELQSIKTLKVDFDSVKIKEKNWKVFSRENVLPLEYQDKSKREKQSYNLKVAFQDDLSDNYKKLFNFFPTQLTISLPCIIHGTFELNSSRNYLNESKKNEYILKELVQLLKGCALFLTSQNIDWRPYKLISPLSSASDSKLIENFYQNLENLKQTERIYPCINDEYKKLENVVYYNDELNGYFKENFPEVLPELLLPLSNEVNNIFKENIFDHKYLVEKMDALSETVLDIPLRAELITQLAKGISFKDEYERFSLLVNELGNVISKDDLTFTPVVRSEESFNIPKSVKVDFMKSELYDLLIIKFESGFDKKEPKSRELQRSIKSVVNLQPYDSNNVIDKIITGTKDALKFITNISDKTNCIKEMVSALYANFKNIENRQEKLKIAVPLISKANSICDAAELYLSKSYPSGELTEVIYGKSIDVNEYLEELSFWEFEMEELSLVENFFLWLGVNRLSKTELVPVINRWEVNDYFNFIFKNGTDFPDDFDRGTLAKSTGFSKIKNFEMIKDLPISHLILLVLKDEQIRPKIESNNERIDWFFTRWRPTIVPEYSYIRFQFISSNLFTKYILEEGGEDLNKLINEDFEIDFDFLGKYGINKTEVKSILIKLGAKESFNDIEPENVYEILRTIPSKDAGKKGKATQTIYKMALESLVKQESTFPIPEDIRYFSQEDGVEDYRPRTTIYYTDNSILPKKILNTLPILNLPKRIGEDNVEKYFGVNSLRHFKVKINEQNLKYNLCDADLNRLFESLKPYLLAYRLQSPNLKRRITDNDTKRKEAKILKNCKIRIVTQCMFKFGENEEILIDEKEFINVKDTFYFRESFIQNVDGLKKDSLFCDGFAEMMCILFKVNDLKNDFRQILKNDLQDTIHLANQDLNKEKIEESFQLLGVSRVEIDLWRNVFELKNKQLLETIETTEILKQKINENLGINIPETYESVDFENFGNSSSYDLIRLLCNSLKLSVEQILPKGLYFWHKSEFINCIKDNEYKFKQLQWAKLKNLPNEQGAFISCLNAFNLNFINKLDIEVSNYKFELEVDYSQIIKKQILNHFNINMDSPFDDSQIQNLYGELLKKYNVEEVDINDDAIRSILFFEGNKEIIEKHLIEQFGIEENESKPEEEDNKRLGSLVDASLSRNGKIIQIPSVNGNGSWIHSGLNDKVKKRKGKKAELLVYNTLVDKYGIENVKWVSGNSTTPDKNDKLHYDLEYKNEGGEWKYLEVKSISDNQFIISGPEKDKGVAEPDKFEMALVNDTTIYLIKDIFKFKQDETFESNSKFMAYAKDYVFFFDIENLTKILN